MNDQVYMAIFHCVLLSEIYASRPHKNNQKVRIDCPKPRSNKNNVE